MGILDRFKKKKKEVEIPAPEPTYRPGLPSDLERFRMQREPVPELPRPEPVFTPPPTPETALAPERREAVDKIDLIIQKLETIDARLKLIEERLG